MVEPREPGYKPRYPKRRAARPPGDEAELDAVWAAHRDTFHGDPSMVPAEFGDEDLRAALEASIEALEYKFSHEHGADWSAADKDRYDRDQAVLDKHIAALRAAARNG